MDRMQERTCSNPVPSGNGLDCTGISAQVVDCDNGPCGCVDPPVPDPSANLANDYVAGTVVLPGDSVAYECAAGNYFSHDLAQANFALNCNGPVYTWDDPQPWQVCVSNKQCPNLVLSAEMTTVSGGPFIHDGIGGDTFE